jgi:hypothetical protein
VSGEVSTGSTHDQAGSTRDGEPLLRVVRGEPTDEELAAVVAVFAGLGGAPAVPARRTPEWNTPRRLQRVVLRHRVDGWRASGLPR